MSNIPEMSERWYERPMRWGQINIREPEAESLDVAWWADYFKRTRIQGLTINAGGIVAYYPTQVPYHRRSPWLGTRDLFGELVTAAKAQGLYILARLDPSKTTADLYFEHPGWYVVDAEGRPVLNDGKWYQPCINGPYFWEHMAAIIREVATNYEVDGFFGNGWQGYRGLCYCTYCQAKFRQRYRREIPAAEDWGDVGYRWWYQFRNECSLDIWKHWDATTKEVKPHSIWVGNLHGLTEATLDWDDCARLAVMVNSDCQGRTSAGPIFQNAAQSKVMRSVMGGRPYWNLFGSWYHGEWPQGHMTFWRQLAKPAPEQTLWMAQTAATGTRPWWHFIGGVQEDERQYRPLERFFQWHADNEQYLRNPESLANVGLVLSQRSAAFYGRERAKELSTAPFYGWYYALLLGRIPFDVVHEGRLQRDDLRQYKLLILPNVACLSTAQAELLRGYVERGGSLIATYETSLYDEWGERKSDYQLGDILGAASTGTPIGPLDHSYMRVEQQHEILNGLEGTPILPNGGMLAMARPVGDVSSPLTLIPGYPIFPPEDTFPRTPTTDQSLLYLREHEASRVAYFPGDIDRHFYETNVPDQETLFVNTIRWALNAKLPVEVEGQGLVDVHANRVDGNKLAVHLINYTNQHAWKGPIRDLIRVGAQRVTFNLPEGVSAGEEARLLVAGTTVPVSTSPAGATVTVPSLLDHEVVVLHLSQ